MNVDQFSTPDGTPVTAVTAAEMASVDRVAVEEFGLQLLQMMENAGRTLARLVRGVAPGSVAVLAGPGGNGGGGLCAARHLRNRDRDVAVVLDRDPDALSGAARTQYDILAAMDVDVEHGVGALDDLAPSVVVDALVGYGLDGALRGPAARLVERIPGAPVVSLDVPSGVDADSGDRPGVAVDPDSVVTLALPKTGLDAAETTLYLVDIAVPAGVYGAIGVPYTSPFGDDDWVELTR